MKTPLPCSVIKLTVLLERFFLSQASRGIGFILMHQEDFDNTWIQGLLLDQTHHTNDHIHEIASLKGLKIGLRLSCRQGECPFGTILTLNQAGGKTKSLPIWQGTLLLLTRRMRELLGLEMPSFVILGNEL